MRNPSDAPHSISILGVNAYFTRLLGLTEPYWYEQLVVELDGCHILPGKKITRERAELTKKRRLPHSQRPSDWREVRVG